MTKTSHRTQKDYARRLNAALDFIDRNNGAKYIRRDV